MQQIYDRGPRFFASLKFLFGVGLLVIAVCLLTAGGCIERPTTIDPVPDRPHAGVVLKVAVSDTGDRELVRQLGLSWGSRQGARVELSDGPWDGTADVALIAPAELGKWAEAGKLAVVPAARRLPTDAYRWDDLLPIYNDRLTQWAGSTYALPVAGEGMVLAYRTDFFDGKDKRPAAPPATWDELFETAKNLGKCLPPVPASADQLGAEFFAAAACYDRRAVGRLIGERPSEDFFAFQFDPTTGNPRLTALAFEHVAKLFNEMRHFRVSAPGAAEAFQSGQAKVGVITLAELARVGPDVAGKLGVAPLPAARFWFDDEGNQRHTAQGTLNRVPYLGWGGRLGVVSASSPHQAAAWDFLADAGMPAGSGSDQLASPRWGAGPFRTSQFDPRDRARWFGYGLAATETERLVSALRDNLGQGVQNYRLRLRTPNQQELSATLDAELRATATGGKPPDAAMGDANAAWMRIIERLPAGQWPAWARTSLGF
jgi:multiple sugar transport system substrate-binding protein